MSEPKTRTLSSVWKLRLPFIFCLTLIGAMIGGYIATLQPQKNVIEVRLEKPNVAELNNYFSLFTTYRLVNEESKMSDEQITEWVYQAFVKQLSSQTSLKAYLQQQPLITNLALYNAIPVEQQLQQLVNDFVIQQQNDILYVTWLSPIANHQLAEELLTGWIQQANTQAKQQLYADLVHKWKTLFQQVKLAAENNLAESWKGKLQIMLSVQRLDDQLVAYRYLQQPQISQSLLTYPFTAIFISGLIGLILGVFLSLMFIRKNN